MVDPREPQDIELVDCKSRGPRLRRRVQDLWDTGRRLRKGAVRVFERKEETQGQIASILIKGKELSSLSANHVFIVKVCLNEITENELTRK